MIVRVSGTIKSGALDGTTTNAIDSTGANLLVATVSWFAGGAAPTLADSKGNTWTKLTETVFGGVGQGVVIYYSVPSSVGSGHTITLAGSNTYVSCSFAAYSGVNSVPFDAEDSNTGNALTSIKPGAMTPSDGDLVITALTYFADTGSATIDSGFTGSSVGFNSGVAVSHGSAYLISDGSAVDPTWSWGSSQDNVVSTIAVFKTASTTSSIAVNADAIYYSPYNWYSDGAGALKTNNSRSDATYLISNTPGAYIKTRFTGTTFAMEVDVAALTGVTANQYPAIEYSVNGGSWTRIQLASSSTTLQLATGLSDATHTIEIVMVGAYWTGVDRWTTPVMAIKVTGYVVDIGKTCLAPSVKANSLLVFSDSHGEGYEAGGAGTTVANQNARLAWPRLLANLLDAEYGAVCFAGQGYTGGAGNVPSMATSWDDYSNARSRLFSSLLSPAPTYIISGHGDNDTVDASVTTVVEALIDAWRVAAPDAVIFLLVPPNLTVATGIANGVTAAADADTHLINTGINYSGIAGDWNGGHLSELGHVAYVTDAFEIIGPLIATTNIKAIRHYYSQQGAL